jgi:hypothetical protein
MTSAINIQFQKAKMLPNVEVNTSSFCGSLVASGAAEGG